MRLIDADAVYKILESCEIRKATIGNPLTDWEYGYTCGIERAESEIECAPTVDAVPVIRCTTPTIYGYPIEHLEMIARVMAKENCTPDDVVRMLQDAGAIAKMVRDEMLEMLKESIERTCKGEPNETD